MKNLFKKTGAIAATGIALTILGVSAASAATFDFVAMSDTSSDDNYIGSNEGNFGDLFPGGVTVGAFTLKASGSNSTSVTANSLADAFFDKGNAGLGVCSSVSCSTQDGQAGVPGTDTGDDNVTAGETLTLDFGQFVDITSLTLFEKHGQLFDGSLTLNGGTLSMVNGVITAGANLLTGASIFSFTHTTDEFYLASATVDTSQNAPVVPLPAGAVLMFTGLGAFGVMGRRRKNAAA